MHRFWIVMILLLFIACSSERTSSVGEQRSPGASNDAVMETSKGGLSSVRFYPVEIRSTPSDATRKSAFYLLSQDVDMSNASIEWLVNDSAVPGQTGREFRSEAIVKGNKIQAKVTVKGREVLSNVVYIRNSPPVVSRVSFVAEGLGTGEALGVQAEANDIDGDEVTIAYEWTKNGEPAGEGRGIKGPLRKGDKVTVRITPFDGETYGRPVTLSREVVNTTPMISENKEFKFDGKVYTYQVRASDPDGETLTYSLRSGPKGMTIDASTGLIRWDVPEDFKGRASFTVVVSDGQGGEASRKLDLDIKRTQE